MMNKLYVAIYLRENDFGLLASRATQLEIAQSVADKFGIETAYSIEDCEGSLIFNVSTHRLQQLISALREAGIRFGTLEVYDKAALSIVETMGIEHEDYTEFAAI